MSSALRSFVHINIPRSVAACRDGSTVYVNYRAQFSDEAKPSRKRKAQAASADDAELDAALEAEQAAGAAQCFGFQETDLGQHVPLNMCHLPEMATPGVAAGAVTEVLCRGWIAPLERVYSGAAGAIKTDVNAAQVAEQAAGATPECLVRTCLQLAPSAVQA